MSSTNQIFESNRRQFLQVGAATALSAVAFGALSQQEAFGAPNAVNLQALAAKLIQSNVRVRMLGEQKNGVGAGTIIETPEPYRSLLLPGERLLVTAGHNATDTNAHTRFQIEFFTSYDPRTHRPVESVQTAPAEVIGYLNFMGEGKQADLALLAVNPEAHGVEAGHVRPLRLAPPDFKASFGEELVTLGCPEGKISDFMVSKIVKEVLEPQGRSYFALSGARVPGHSGGGAFNSDGELVGVCSFTTTLEDKMVDSIVEYSFVDDRSIAAANPNMLYMPRNLSPAQQNEFAQNEIWRRTPDFVKERGRGGFDHVREIWEYLDAKRDDLHRSFDLIEQKMLRPELRRPEATQAEVENGISRLRNYFELQTSILADPVGSRREFHRVTELYLANRFAQ